MDYGVQSLILNGLVKLLRPAKEDSNDRPEFLDGMLTNFCCNLWHRTTGYKQESHYKNVVFENRSIESNFT